MTVAP